MKSVTDRKCLKARVYDARIAIHVELNTNQKQSGVIFPRESVVIRLDAPKVKIKPAILVLNRVCTT
jgi:hypothetical protein